MKTLAGLVVVMVSLTSMASHEAMARELTVKEKAVIMKAVRNELTDPESARFKWVKLAEEVDIKSPDAVSFYCGLVNAKNKMGGYVGDKPFLAILGWRHGKIHPAAFVQVSGNASDEFLFSKCAEKGYTNLFLAE